MFEEILKKPLDFFDKMKLQGIMLPASVAVSTPTIVPVCALEATVRLLIVIVMNLSGRAISSLDESLVPLPEWGDGDPFRRANFANIVFALIHIF